MSDQKTKRIAKAILFVFGLYKLHYGIALAAIIGCVCFPFGSEWFYVLLIAAIQFGVAGLGSQLEYEKFKNLENSIDE